MIADKVLALLIGSALAALCIWLGRVSARLCRHDRYYLNDLARINREIGRLVQLKDSIRKGRS